MATKAMNTITEYERNLEQKLGFWLDYIVFGLKIKIYSESICIFVYIN